MKQIWTLSIPSFLVLALVSLTVSTIFDGGFFKGVFQGAAAALLALAVFLVFLRRRSVKSGADPADGMWLPSRDEER